MNEVFKALADPTRRKILHLLKDNDLTAGQIADQFAMTKPSISNHLSILKTAELVMAEKQGQYVVYSINTTLFQDVIKWLLQLKGGEDE